MAFCSNKLVLLINSLNLQITLSNNNLRERLLNSDLRLKVHYFFAVMRTGEALSLAACPDIADLHCGKG